MPITIFVYLLFVGHFQSQRHQRFNFALKSATSFYFAFLHRRYGEVWLALHSLCLSTCFGIVLRLDLRFGLCGCKSFALVHWVMDAQVVWLAIGLITKRKTDIEQAATPCTACQLVCTPIYIHRNLIRIAINACNSEWLFVSGRRMQHLLIVHKPTIEIAIAWMDTWIMFRLERAFENQFLPNAIVGREVDMFEQLTIQQFVDIAISLLCIDLYRYFFLCIACHTCNGK